MSTLNRHVHTLDPSATRPHPHLAVPFLPIPAVNQLVLPLTEECHSMGVVTFTDGQIHFKLLEPNPVHCTPHLVQAAEL